MPEPVAIATVVGARPQFIKAAVVIRALENHPVDHTLIHTGQHYDDEMSAIFFEELELPPPDVNLGVGSGPHGRQTARMLTGIEEVLVTAPPDVAVIYGDTNSTVAGALAAAKLGVPVAHVEAGVRSFNRRMPEELNRVVADRISDLLLAPTATAMDHLAREGLAARAVLTGDVMYDSVLVNSGLAERRSRAAARLDPAPGSYGLVTLHRAENTDDGSRLRALVSSLEAVAEKLLPLHWPLHPRTRAALGRHLPGWTPGPRLRLTAPVGYLDMLMLIKRSRIVLTDSGGVQKEAFFLGVPCVTLRPETEWVETVQAGWNRLVEADPAAVLEAASAFLAGAGAAADSSAGELFGGGRAAERVTAELVRFCRSGSRRRSVA